MDNANEYIEEKNIKGQVNPITDHQMKVFQEKMKCVCVVEIGDGTGTNEGTGTGFFCKIPFPDGFNLLPVLITNNHVIKNMEKSFVISYNKIYEIIDMSKHRRFYTEKKYDITIIEILKDDKIGENLFLETEIKENIEKISKEVTNIDIYVIHYPKGQEISISPGKIEKINNNNIIHSCSTDYGSSGGPILNKDTFKVIGIHKGRNKNKNSNIGSLISKPIEEFNEKNNSNITNDNELIYNSKIDNKNIKQNDKNINNYSDINNQIIISNNANNKILEHKNNDEITIQYKIKKSIIPFFSDKNVKIFGENFVKNNKNICKIIVNEKEEELKSILNIEDIPGDMLIIKLKGINNITNMSFMFEGCESLSYIFGMKEWNTINVIDMNHMFSKCKKNEYLPNDISDFNTQNVKNINGMFSECESLKKMPDISKRKTNNVEDTGHLFHECCSLESLPDISKWDTKNIRNIKYLFFGCTKLKNIPDISKWNTENLKCMDYIFWNCTSLENKPNISKWNTKNIVQKEKEDELGTEDKIALGIMEDWAEGRNLDTSY